MKFILVNDATCFEPSDASSGVIHHVTTIILIYFTLLYVSEQPA